MRYPARLAHLATRAIVVAKVAPTFADAHHIEHEEAVDRLNSALTGPLLEDLLASRTARSGRAAPSRSLRSLAPSSCSRTSPQGRRATLPAG